MSQFPVHSSDSRCCYRAGCVPGCALGLALIAALLGYAGLSHAEPMAGSTAEICTTLIPPHADVGRALAAQL